MHLFFSELSQILLLSHNLLCIFGIGFEGYVFGITRPIDLVTEHIDF